MRVFFHNPFFLTFLFGFALALALARGLPASAPALAPPHRIAMSDADRAELIAWAEGIVTANRDVRAHLVTITVKCGEAEARAASADARAATADARAMAAEGNVATLRAEKTAAEERIWKTRLLALIGSPLALLAGIVLGLFIAVCTKAGVKVAVFAGRLGLKAVIPLS